MISQNWKPFYWKEQFTTKIWWAKQDTCNKIVDTLVTDCTASPMCSWHDLNILSHSGGSSGHGLGSEQESNLGAPCPGEVPYPTTYVNKDAVGLPVQPAGLYLFPSLIFGRSWVHSEAQWEKRDLENFRGTGKPLPTHFYFCFQNSVWQ